MTKELSDHHMPLQKQSTSTLLFPAFQTRRDCCEHLVCFPYYSGNRVFPEAGLKCLFPKAAQAYSLHVPGNPSTPTTGRDAFSGNNTILSPKGEFVWLQHPTIASDAAFLLAGWKSPVYAEISVCKYAQAVISQPFLSNKMNGSRSTQPPATRFICLPCQKSFPLPPPLVQWEESRTGCNSWVALPSTVQPLLPETRVSNSDTTGSISTKIHKEICFYFKMFHSNSTHYKFLIWQY